MNSLYPEVLPNLPPAGRQLTPASLARRRNTFAICALVVSLACAVDLARADPPGAIHYPDLWPYYAYGLRSDAVNGRRLLSFNTAIANLGQGPLDVFAQNDPAAGTTDAYQRLFTHDASGQWVLADSRYVGRFEFHVAHDHWHFENFAAYQLRNTAPDGSVGPTVLASSMKVSFCLRDDWQASTSLEHAMPQTYVECSASKPQGIAVGWTDIYAWSLEGQNVDITNLRDGTYWLLITVDPGNVLAEGGAVKANNTNGTKFQLSDHGKRIKIVRYGL